MAGEKATKRLYALGMFLGVSVLCGLLMAGLAFPLASAAGGAAKIASDSIDDLPADFEEAPRSERSTILLADGSVLAQFYNENRVNVTLDKISTHMQHAQVAIEDKKFYEHGAINLEGTLRALIRNSRGGDVQGGSTLTQQYVKMMAIERAIQEGDEEAQKKAQEKSIERKILELRYAIALEKRLTKDQILEGYLNIAYYGAGAYGVEAAAHRYFSTTADKLTIGQSALLAGLVQNPSQIDPISNPAAALNRRSFVLGEMMRDGYITEAERAAADAEPFDKTKVQPLKNGCFSARYPHICDYVQRVLLSDDMKSLGDTAADRTNLLNRGGLTIQTLIDPKTQDAAEAALYALVKPSDPVLATSVMLDPKTGYIVAMAQSKPKQGNNAGETFYNYTVSKKMGGAEGYSGGSTFKTFTLAAAFEKGFPAVKTYDSPSKKEMKGETFTNCTGPFRLTSSWEVSNSGSSYGNIDMYKATASSVNTYFAQLIRDVGICQSVKMAERMGLQSATGESLLKIGQNPTFVLGQVDITPLSLTEAYATLANRGVRCEPRILSSIKSRDGKEIAVPKTSCQKVMEPEIADAVTKLLVGVLRGGTASAYALPGGYSQAGKTGTTVGNEAVWFAGFTPDLAGTAMIAVDKDPKVSFWNNRKRTLANLRLPSGTYIRGFGGTDAAPIWRSTMLSGLQGRNRSSFVEPPYKLMNGERVSIPRVGGMSIEQARRTLEAAGFTTTIFQVYDQSPAGTFLGTSPSGSAPRFSTIALRVSRGPDPSQPVSPPPVAPSPGG